MERRQGLRHIHTHQVQTHLLAPATLGLSLSTSAFIPKVAVSDPNRLTLTLKASPQLRRIRGRV